MEPPDPSEPIDGILTAHMVLQVFTWGLLLPAGMVLGLTKSRWHVPVQTLGILLTIVGVQLAVSLHSGVMDVKLKWFLASPWRTYFLPYSARQSCVLSNLLPLCPSQLWYLPQASYYGRQQNSQDCSFAAQHLWQDLPRLKLDANGAWCCDGARLLFQRSTA